jgi:CTP:molybdopterin cytidylyltransferase MocA
MECQVTSGRITDAAFSGDACAICVASASILAEHVTGLSVREAMAIDTADVVGWLGIPISPARTQCAELPLETLRRALAPFATSSQVRPVILAAGAATRFGGSKLTAEIDGVAMIRRVVSSYVATAGGAIVVVSPMSDVAAALDGLAVELVENRDAAEGIASSIRVGVAAAAKSPAVMIVLGDEPIVDPALVARLTALWEESGAAVVAPRYRGEIGHPVIFDRSCFAELERLAGDVGARGVIAAAGDRARFVDLDRERPVDIDTREDLERL